MTPRTMTPLKRARKNTTLTKRMSAAQVGLVHGFRSGLEETLAAGLEHQGIPVIFEEFYIPWKLEKNCKYTPDFLLPNGIIVEGKGRFVTADRQKHIEVKKQHPDLDIRFVFSRSKSTISKTSKTTYAKWCNTKGFQYADKFIPQKWMGEPVNEASLAAVREILKQQNREDLLP